jgi:predicted Fe-S protein YdhL (DUF1289 family)
MNDNADNIKSPCIRNCCLDQKDVCLGCFRSLSEIVDWGQAGRDERNTILLNAKERAANYDKQHS